MMLLLLTTLAFAALAIYAPTLISKFAAQRRLRPPHPALVLAFRVWFGVLALAAFWLLLQHHRFGR
jgi:uncharacterized membrane protein YccC